MIKLPNEIFGWLTESDLWRYEEIKENNLPTKDGFTALSVNMLLNGSLFLCLTNKVCELRNLPYLNVKLGKAQFGNSIATRLINWQHIQRQLKGLGIIIDNDVKSLIAHGDYMLAYETLKNCYKKLVNPDFRFEVTPNVLLENQQALHADNTDQKNSISPLLPNQHFLSQSMLVNKNAYDQSQDTNQLSKHSKSLKFNPDTQTPLKDRSRRIEQENETALTSNKKVKSSAFATKYRQKSQSLVILKNMADQNAEELFGRNNHSIAEKVFNGNNSNRNASSKIVLPMTVKKENGESALALFKTNDAQYHLYIKKKPTKLNTLMPVRVVGKQPFETHSSNYSFQQQYRKLAPSIDIDKCENVLELLIIVTAKVFNLEPKNCLNFFLNQSAYFNNLWMHGEEEHAFKRLINFLKILDEHHEKIVALICNQHSEIFDLFMNVSKNIWKTENFEIAKLFIDFLIKFLHVLKQTNRNICLVEKVDLADDLVAVVNDKLIPSNVSHTKGYSKNTGGYTDIHGTSHAPDQPHITKPQKYINTNNLFVFWLDKNTYFFQGINEVVDRFPDLHPNVFALFKMIESDNLDVWDILQKVKAALNNNNQYFTFLRNMIETKNSKIFIEFHNKYFLKKVIEELVETFLSYGSKAGPEKRASIIDNIKKFKGKGKDSVKDKKDYILTKDKLAPKEKVFDLKPHNENLVGKPHVNANQKIEYSEFFSVTKILIKIIINENFGKVTFIKSFLDKIEKLFFSIPKYKENLYDHDSNYQQDKKESGSIENLDELSDPQRMNRYHQQSINLKKSRFDDISNQIELALIRKTMRNSQIKGIFETQANNIPQSNYSKINPQIFLNVPQKIEIILQLFTLFICEKESLDDIKSNLGVMFRKIIVFLDGGFEDVKEFLITLIFKCIDLEIVSNFLKYELFPSFQEYLNKIYNKRLILSEWEVKLIKYYLNTDDLKTSDSLVFAKSAFLTFMSFFDISEFIFTEFVQFLHKNKEQRQFLTLFLLIVKECVAKILDIERKTSYISKEKLYVKISDLLEQQQINRKVVHLFKELQRRSLFTELIKELIGFEIPKVNDYVKLLIVYFNTQYKAFIDEKNDGLKVIPNCKAYESLYVMVRNDESDVLSKYELAAEIAVKSKGLLNDDKLAQIANDEISLRLNDKKVKNLQKVRQDMDNYKEFEKYVKEGKEADIKVKQNIINIQQQNDKKKTDESKQKIIKFNKEKMIKQIASKQVAKNFQMLEAHKGVSFASLTSIHAVEKTVVIEFMKEYRSFFKSIFNFYSSKNNEVRNMAIATLLTNSTEKAGPTFNVVCTKKFMYPSHFWKMMVDFDLNKYISFDDFNSEIVKSYFVYESSLKSTRGDSQHYNILKEEKLDFQTFQEFFLNIFCRVFLTPKKLINPNDLLKMMKYMVTNCKHKVLMLNKFFDNPLLNNPANITTYNELKKELKLDNNAPMPMNFTAIKFTRFDESTDFSETPVIISDILDTIITVDVLKEEKVNKIQYMQIKTFYEFLPKEKQGSTMINSTSDQKQNTKFNPEEENAEQENGNQNNIEGKGKFQIVNSYMQTIDEQNMKLEEKARFLDFMRKKRDKLLKAKLAEYRKSLASQENKKDPAMSRKKTFKKFNLKKFMTQRKKAKKDRPTNLGQKLKPSLASSLKNELKKLRSHFSKLITKQKKIAEEATHFEAQMKSKFIKYQKKSLINCEKYRAISTGFHEKILEQTDLFKVCSVYDTILSSMGPLLETIFESYTTYFLKYDYFDTENREISLKVLYILLKNFGFVPTIFKSNEIVKFLNNYMFHIRKDEKVEDINSKRFDFSSFNDLFYVLILHKSDMIASSFDTQSEDIIEYAKSNNFLMDKLDFEALNEQEDKFTVNVVKSILTFHYWNRCSSDAKFATAKLQETRLS